jgi:DNA-binding IclR family transcriptional regulator
MLVKNLEDTGYLDRIDEDRTFLPSLRIRLLGDWLQSSMPIADSMIKLMVDLQRQTGETILLGRQRGPNLQYIAVEQEDFGVQLRMKPGILRPMSLAACGHVLLALKPASEARVIIRRNNAEAATPAHHRNESELIHRLSEISISGYSESDALLTSGASVLAMAIIPKRGEKPLAIGVGCPVDRMAIKRRRIIDLLRGVVDELASSRDPA